MASGATIPYAAATRNLHHEIELVVAIGRAGANIPREKALEHVYGYAVGIDLTRRDLQLAARDKGRPWDAGKGFDDSAPIGAILRAADRSPPERGRIWLRVNGETKQSADIADLIWPVPDIVAKLSELFTLRPGDLVYTGTPAGVGPVVTGDRIEGGIDGIGEILLQIGA